MLMRRFVSLILPLALAAALPVQGAEARRPQTETEKKSLEYLVSHQDENGAWVPQAGPAVTAMVVKALLQAGKPVDDPVIQKALAFIDKNHQPDGGWYANSNATYNTSIALSTVSMEQLKARYAEQIKDAQAFLKAIQSGAVEAARDDKGKAVDKDHPWFGGWGYSQGGKMPAGKRPDLSNSQFAIAALRDSGVPSSDQSIQNAVVFLSRVQAYEGNPSPWAKGRDDGGFIYSMRWNDKHQFFGESEGQDSRDRDGNDIITAYGSMTYAGLKSLLYADIAKDDPRVKAALKYISANYTLDQNPGLNSPQGLYYYYHTFSTALHAYGQPAISDAKGVQHDWRRDLEEKLASVQKPDGSFVNAADRWMESNPVLVTTYVALALQDARK